MCLAQGPQRSDAGEARTRYPSVSSQALYHWATALPGFIFVHVQFTPLNTFIVFKDYYKTNIKFRCCLSIYATTDISGLAVNLNYTKNCDFDKIYINTKNKKYI